MLLSGSSNSAKRCLAPFLQSPNDPRVLQAESDDKVEAIRVNGGIVEYVVFDDEGHGFRKSANRVEGYEAVADFLDLHLKNGG